MKFGQNVYLKNVCHRIIPLQQQINRFFCQTHLPPTFAHPWQTSIYFVVEFSIRNGIHCKHFCIPMGDTNLVPICPNHNESNEIFVCVIDNFPSEPTCIFFLCPILQEIFRTEKNCRILILYLSSVKLTNFVYESNYTWWIIIIIFLWNYCPNHLVTQKDYNY